MPSSITLDETRFRSLLERWLEHQDLRAQGAPLPVLAASRARLDAVRYGFDR